jgi:hypothetical protein
MRYEKGGNEMIRAIDRRGFLIGLGVVALGAQARAEATPLRSEILQGKRYIIEGGRVHRLADTVFEVVVEYPDDMIGLEVGDFAEIDVLRVRLHPGVTKMDRFIRLGEGVRIGLIDVEAAEQTDAHDESQDGFLQICRANIEVGALRFRNIGRCALVRNATNLRIGSLECESYSKALKLDRSEDVYVGLIRTRITSSKAGKHLGYSCITIEDSHRVIFPQVEVEDAAEHAVYIGGGSGKEFSQDIRFGNVVSRRSNGCGFKCKASSTANVEISVDSLTITDAGFGDERPGPGEDALRVENCHGFHVGTLNVSRAERQYSCYSGIYLDGVAEFSLNGGHVVDTFGPMVRVEDERALPNKHILISQLSGTNIGADAYRIDHSHDQMLQEMVVVGGTLTQVDGDAINIKGGARKASKPPVMRLDSVKVRAGMAPRTGMRARKRNRSNQITVTETGDWPK